ncbi:MAG: rod shape-determining protein MreC [Thermodesulfobacteriota bacterium]
MFSRKTLVIAGLLLLVAVNGVVFSYNYMRKSSFYPAAVETALFFVGPLQDGVSRVTGFAGNVWSRYFMLVTASMENETLRRELAEVRHELHLCREETLLRDRVESFLEFKEDTEYEMVVADVVGREPSAWFESIIINKGKADGVKTGLPVMVPEGIVGQVSGVSGHYAKVLLIVDRNNAVDTLVQRTRARGIVRGLSSNACRFEFALHKADITTGDIVITSGLDGIFPKGLRVGRVSKIIRRSSGIFQEIEIAPFVDFSRLEEVMVIINPPDIDLSES